VGDTGDLSPWASAASTKAWLPSGALDTLSLRPEDTGMADWIEGLSREDEAGRVRSPGLTSCTGPRLAWPDRVAPDPEGPMEAMSPAPEDVAWGTREVTWLGAAVFPSLEGAMDEVLPPEAVLPPVRSVTALRLDVVL